VLWTRGTDTHTHAADLCAALHFPPTHLYHHHSNHIPAPCVPVEARSLSEAREAASVGADIVMLDNYTPDRLREDAAALKAEFPALIIEGSGVCTLRHLAAGLVHKSPLPPPFFHEHSSCLGVPWFAVVTTRLCRASPWRPCRRTLCRTSMCSPWAC
jgi:hypothetical protein